MSDFGDWEDPFGDDERAEERRRRRAEREERREDARRSIGERVSEGEEVPAAHDESPFAGAAEPPDAAGAARFEEPPPPAPAASGPVPPPRKRRPPASSGGGVSDRDLMIRRVVGLGLLVAALVIASVGAAKVWDAIGGGDDEPVDAGPATLAVENFTIPEGLDRRQIADLAKEAGLKGDYAKAAKRAPNGFPIDRYAPDDRPPHLEGFLFPAQYELEKNASVDDLVAKQLEAFERNLAEVDLSYAESKNLNVYDVLKIASMVEREIQVAKERRLAAAVIYNRLAAGDTLGIDATIRYEDQNYDEQLTLSRLEEDTPYNTRTNAGLPPTPIGNPGLASIRAAANPARSDAYYFVVRPGTCGEHVFVETEEEFQAAEAEYQAALQAEGGSPTDCG